MPADNSAAADVLSKKVVYDGDGYTRNSIQDMLTEYQGKHEQSLKKFDDLSENYKRLSKEMTVEVADEKSSFEYLGNLFRLRDVGTNLKGLIQKLPVVGQFAPSRDLKELLGEKIEVAQRRVQEVGDYLDILQNDIKNLQLDIERLNKKTVVAAQNEAKAAAYVLELEKALADLDAKLKALDPKSAEGRDLSAKMDEVKRLIWEHGSKLRLYHNAADRLAAIVSMNNNFLEIMTSLNSNMSTLYEAGNEVLNELHGNLAGLSTISKAGELSIEMHKSMESLKKSVNRMAVLASETSLYLTQNVDKLTAEMKVYDKSTEDLVASNLAAEKEIKEQRVNETIALARKEYANSQPAGGGA
ncbi:MAG TPA: hypothetical protein VNI01_13120 [Elusimicrobiota bacterium]|jgi:hypothetical protein|nr:hypothetical protein [Elusimicrobiota bacterium]